MLKSKVLLCGFLSLFTAIMATPGQAQDGKTIFGENKKETFKAMKGISKSLGVKCLYCHVKEGGKIKYKTDTPHKKLARLMKVSFVDSLVQKGASELEIAEEHHKTIVKAVYQAKGKDAGIHLTATTLETPGTIEELITNKDGKSHQKVVALPAEGKSLNCMTCHNGKVHILTEEEEK